MEGSNQKVILGIIIAVALVVGGGLFLMNRPPASPTPAPAEVSPTRGPSPTESTSELDSSQKELEGTEIDASLDAELKLLDSDSSAF